MTWEKFEIYWGLIWDAVYAVMKKLGYDFIYDVYPEEEEVE